MPLRLDPARTDPIHRELAVALLELSTIGVDVVMLTTSNGTCDPSVYEPLRLRGLVHLQADPGAVMLTAWGLRWAKRWRDAPAND